MELNLSIKDRSLTIDLCKKKFKSPVFLYNRNESSDEFDKNDVWISIEISNMDFNDYIRIIGFMKYAEDTYETKLVQYDDIEDDGSEVMVSGFIYINVSRLLRLERDTCINICHNE